MARKRTSLVRKEAFINQMILDSMEHTHGFNVDSISNGTYDFGEINEFLKKNNLVAQFREYLIESRESFGLDVGEVYIDEVSDEDLPFAEKDFFKDKPKT